MAISSKDGREHKKPRLAHTMPTVTFKTGAELRQALRTADSDQLVKAFTSFRNQISMRSNEASIPLSDERVVFVHSWLEGEPDAQCVFDVWGQTNARQTNLLVLVVSALSNLVSLLSSASSQQQLGQPIIRLLLSPQWSQRLNTYISGSHSELVLVTLKLWNSLSNFGAGSERKAVLDAFAWESKALPKLLFMRRKGRAVDTSNPLTKPDIRTLYMFFVLSFVNASTPSSVKTGFVERHGDPLRSVFKGLAQDPYAVVRQVLERCWTGLWSDVKVKRTLKIQVFNEATIAHIVKLYGRNEAEDDEVDHIPADVAHHFLVAICTRPGSGVCFRDRGWYPRLSEEDEAAQAEDDDVETTKQDSGRIYNKILANVLRGLKPNEDARQQELVLKILCACPELVSRFWSGAGLTMEPRLSSRWLTNISLFGAIVSLPVPSDGFLVPGSTSQYQISPPPLSTLLENVLPSVGIKMHLTKGLQSTAAMVQHASTLALVKCLQKLDETLRAFKVVEAAIEETEGTGRWSTRRRELELEARRRVPDFQVILAFVQHSQKINANRTKLDMLSEAGQRLLWLYHVLLPGLVAENKFDAGKLLQQFAGDSHDISAELAEATDVHRGLETMRRLHALRLLGEADQVIISGKASSSIRTNMFVLLKQYIVANDNAIRSGLSSLIRRQLSDTLLFQHQPEEVDIWLSALDFAIQLPLPEIHDEVDDLLAFLDDCIQRCFKTPYRYLDEWDQLLVDTPNASAVGKVQFSPLLLTFLEQLHAKVAGSHLSLSSLVRIACFFRELVFSLATASFDITPLDECVRRAEKTMNGLDSSSAVIAPAQAEIAALVVSMNSLRTGPEKHPVKPEFWDPSTKTLTFGNLTIRAPFTRALTETPTEYLLLPNCRHALVNLLTSPGLSRFDVKMAIHAVLHRYGALGSDPIAQRDCIYLLADLLLRALPAVPEPDRDSVKSFVFEECDAIVRLCQSLAPSSHLPSALDALVKNVLNPARVLDRRIGATFADYWLAKDVGLPEEHDYRLQAQLLWIPYGTPEQKLILLEGLQRSDGSFVQPSLAQEVLDVTRRFLSTSASSVDVQPVLIHLKRAHEAYITNEDVTTRINDIIASVVEQSLPSGHNGDHRHGKSSLAVACNRASLRWKQRGGAFQDDIDTPNVRKPLSEAEVRVLLYQIYRKESVREVVEEAIKSGDTPLLQHLDQMVRVVDALCDCRAVVGRTVDLGQYGTAVFEQVIRIAVDPGAESEDRQASASCAGRLIETSPVSFEAFMSSFTKAVGRVPIDRFTSQTLSLAAISRRTDAIKSKSALSTVVEHGMRWTVRYYAEDLPQTEDAVDCVDRLAQLIAPMSSLKSHLAEPVVEAVIQHRLHQPQALRLATTILRSTALKPVVVNRYIQNILQHPRFAETGQGNVEHLWEQTAKFIYALFFTHPVNTCQPSHVEPLLGLYRGTMSEVDRTLLSIFQLFETQRAASVASLFSRWTASPGHNTAGTALDALRSLDSVTMFRTCLSFPRARTMSGHSRTSRDDIERHIYDPVFATLLFSQTIRRHPPETALVWVEVFRTNVVSLMICALSAKYAEVRELALNQIATLRTVLKDADMQEKPLVLHILDIVRGLGPTTTVEASVSRIPSYTTLLLAHALRGVFYPSNFIYPLTARFLLQRPMMDPTDVPMLLSMLYSSGDDWKKERAWILRFLADGMTCGRDWKVFKRRHTWDLIASLFQASEKDKTLRQGALDLLLNISSVREATMSLILKSALLAWIEAQLHTVQASEAPAWAMILENIMVVVDSGKLDSGTYGSWRSNVARCLLSLLDQTDDIKLLPIYGGILSRLVALPGSAPPQTNSIAQKLFGLLEKQEEAVDGPLSIDSSGRSDAAERRDAGMPHRAHGGHQDASSDPTLRSWAGCVETLWQSVMALQEKSTVWDAISARMVFWRALGGDQAGEASEWVRKETIRVLQIS